MKSSYTGSENTNWCSHWKIVWQFLKTAQHTQDYHMTPRFHSHLFTKYNWKRVLIKSTCTHIQSIHSSCIFNNQKWIWLCDLIFSLTMNNFSIEMIIMSIKLCWLSLFNHYKTHLGYISLSNIGYGLWFWYKVTYVVVAIKWRTISNLLTILMTSKAFSNTIYNVELVLLYLVVSLFK